jgi:predicted metal-dependent hydrolase
VSAGGEDGASAHGRSLPEYAVRVSARARRVRLVVSAREGLVVVVPRNFRGDVAQIVASKREWAERALERVADRRSLHAAGAEALLPDRIELPAFRVSLPVEYRATASATTSARAANGALVVSGNIDDAEACLAALTRWLDREARSLLLPMLAEVARDAGIAYASARVRRQRSRWGSCSARRTISLSRNLVFLPRHLVRALMLHELAHLRVMDHSPRFWAELGRLDPHAQRHRAEMRHAADHVPPWAEA